MNIVLSFLLLLSGGSVLGVNSPGFYCLFPFSAYSVPAPFSFMRYFRAEDIEKLSVKALAIYRVKQEQPNALPRVNDLSK